MNRLVLALGLLTAAGCGKKDGDQEPPRAARADAAVAATPADAATRAPAADPGQRFLECVAAFNARDLAALRGCYAPDAVGIAADSPPEMKGADEILGANQSFWKAFPDIELEPQVVLVKGRKVAALVLSHGTNSGPLSTAGGELAPTNAVAGTLGVVMVEYDGAGRATSETQYLDSGQVLRQLAHSPQARPPLLTGAAAPVHAVAGGAPAQGDLEQHAERLVAAFNSRDWKAIKGGLVNAKVLLRDMGRSEDLRGADAVIADGKALVKAASDARLTARATWAAGDYVVMEDELSGTSDGPWPPLTSKGTGKPFTVRVAQLLRYAEGKPVEIWRVANGIALLQQLGVAPPATPSK